MPQPFVESHLKTVKQLQSFCRGEMSAVESYTCALFTEVVRPWAPTLRACRQSHRDRVRLLAREISKLGGKVPKTSGPWGTFTEAVEGTAATMGPEQAILMLKEGEEHGLRDYLADLEKLSPHERALVERSILPAQRDTVRAITELRQSFH